MFIYEQPQPQQKRSPLNEAIIEIGYLGRELKAFELSSRALNAPETDLHILEFMSERVERITRLIEEGKKR